MDQRAPSLDRRKCGAARNPHVTENEARHAKANKLGLVYSLEKELFQSWKKKQGTGYKSVWNRVCDRDLYTHIHVYTIEAVSCVTQW